MSLKLGCVCLTRTEMRSKLRMFVRNWDRSWVCSTELEIKVGCLTGIEIECLAFQPEADLGFSRGGRADFQKIFQKFDDLFFLGRPNWFLFSRLSQSSILPLFWQNFLRRRQIFEKTVWKILTKKLRFFGARSPSQIAYIGAAYNSIYWHILGKILGSIG